MNEKFRYEMIELTEEAVAALYSSLLQWVPELFRADQVELVIFLELVSIPAVIILRVSVPKR